MNVLELNQHFSSFFNGLQFEEKEHIYHYDGRDLPSVSSFLNKVAEKVDFIQKAIHVANREGVTQEEVLARWKKINTEAIDRGKQTHSFAEQDTHDNPELKQEEAVQKFFRQLNEQCNNRYLIVSKELQMVHKTLYYCGTSDLLIYDKHTNTFIIGDWKTNKDLFKNFKGKTLLEPFEYMLDCPFSKYQIQLCMYQMMFEQLGYTVSERWIIWTQANGEPIKYDGYDCRQDIMTAFFN